MTEPHVVSPILATWPEKPKISLLCKMHQKQQVPEGFFTL